MTEEVKTAPTPEESKQAEEAKVAEAEKAKVEAEAKAKAETEAKEATMGELLKVEENPKDQRLVPEAVLLEYKSQNKELRKDIKELRELIESGASKTEVSEDLKAIAEEHNVDVDFLTKLEKNIRSKVETDLASKFKPLQDRENQERIEKIFTEHFDKSLEAMPEYKDIVNRDVIKKLSLLPENASKTFKQIIEDTYKNVIKVVPGKKTIEQAKGGGGGAIGEIDFNKAKTDTEYFNEIMASPELKKKYNADLAQRVNL